MKGVIEALRTLRDTLILLGLALGFVYLAVRVARIAWGKTEPPVIVNVKQHVPERPPLGLPGLRLPGSRLPGGPLLPPLEDYRR